MPPEPVATHFEDTTFRLNYVVTEERGAVLKSSPATKRFSFSGIASTIAVIAVALTGWVAFQTFNSTKEVDVVSNEKGQKNGSSKDNSNSNNATDTLMILEKIPLTNDTLKSQVAENRNNSGANKSNENGSTNSNKSPKNEVISGTKQDQIANAGEKPDGKIKPNIVIKPNTQNPIQANKGAKPPSVIAKSKSPQTKPKTKTPSKPTPPPVTEPKINIGDIKIVPSTDVPITKTEPPAEVKTYRVRLVLKGEMKKAEISVDGQSVDQYLKKNIWGTPQYIEFKSSKERHTITFKRGNVSCSVTDVLIENGDLTVEPCSF